MKKLFSIIFCAIMVAGLAGAGLAQTVPSSLWLCCSPAGNPKDLAQDQKNLAPYLVAVENALRIHYDDIRNGLSTTDPTYIADEAAVQQAYQAEAPYEQKFLRDHTTGSECWTIGGAVPVTNQAQAAGLCVAPNTMKQFNYMSCSPTDTGSGCIMPSSAKS